MFLTESTMYATNNLGITDDPATLLEATLEAQEEYQRLTETMVVLEHKAIVTENASLLKEAEDTFSERVKENAKMLGQKIIAFLEKCRAKAQEIALRIAAPLIKKWATRKSDGWKDKTNYKLRKKLTVPSWYGGKTQALPKVITDMNDATTSLNAITNVNSSNSEKIKTKIREMKDEYSDALNSNGTIEKDDGELSTLATNAVQRLQNIKQLINACGRFAQAVSNVQKIALKNAKEDRDKDAIKEARAGLTYISRVYSIGMNYIFKIVGVDIKVLRHLTVKKA